MHILNVRKQVQRLPDIVQKNLQKTETPIQNGAHLYHRPPWLIVYLSPTDVLTVSSPQIRNGNIQVDVTSNIECE